MCEGVPVATALDKLRPCTGAEVLAYQVLNHAKVPTSEDQQRFVDQRQAEDESFWDIVEEDPDEAPDESADFWQWQDDLTIARVHMRPRRKRIDPQTHKQMLATKTGKRKMFSSVLARALALGPGPLARPWAS